MTPPGTHEQLSGVQTYFNTKLKKMRLEAEEKAKKEREGKD